MYFLFSMISYPLCVIISIVVWMQLQLTLAFVDAVDEVSITKKYVEIAKDINAFDKVILQKIYGNFVEVSRLIP